MEQQNHDKIIQIEAALEYIKKDTSEIKTLIGTFLTQITNQTVRLEKQSERIRALEAQTSKLEVDLEKQKSFTWKLATALALVSSGVSIGLERIL